MSIPTLAEQISFVESCVQSEAALSPALRSPVKEWMTPHILSSLRLLSASYTALAKYGDHFPECAVIQECGRAVKPTCSCGFSAALSKGSQP